MTNVMTIGGYKAVIAYDPEIELFRGEFVGLNGGADFYAPDIAGLRREGETSLRVFLDACERRGIAPRTLPTGRFELEIDPALQASIAAAAQAEGTSIEHWIQTVLKERVDAGG
jgi:predicted HicB family RNase H-like nuclease